mgnify:CR=1 FL=1
MRYAIVGGGPFARRIIRDFKVKAKIQNYFLKEVPTSDTKAKLYWYKRVPRPATRQGRVMGKDEMEAKYGPNFTMTLYYDKYLKERPTDLVMHPLMEMIEDGKIEIGRKKKNDPMKRTQLLIAQNEDVLKELLAAYPELENYPIMEYKEEF